MGHKHTGLELAAQILLEQAQNSGKVSQETLKLAKEHLRGKKT